MRPFSDPEALSTEDLARVKEIVRRQGLPDAWLETETFRRNLVRMFTAVGTETRALILQVADLVSRPNVAARLRSMSQRYDSAGALMTLARTLLIPAFDQPLCETDPAERYEPMAGYAPAYIYDALDLAAPAFASRFFYEHETASGEVDEEAIDRALSAVSPEVVAIGSGPACATALSMIQRSRPNTAILVLDLGDHFSQADYDARSPSAVGFETLRQGGSQIIFNGLGRASANFIPQVWGGGAEIFSGTAHALPDWYLERMPMRADDRARHEAQIRQDCRIATTPWDILNDAQKRFFRGAEGLGFAPYLLDGFGRGGDSGNGRCYAGKKGRIPYLDHVFRNSDAVFGIANCRVDAIRRRPDGHVAALELSFISRRTRRPIATRTLELGGNVRVLLGAGSLGDQRVLAQSGEAIALSRRPGVLHQYTCEIAALFDEPLSSNGIPQGIGMQIAPDEMLPDGEVRRRVCIEGAHPGRALLCALGVPHAGDRVESWRVMPRVGSVGLMFTESKPGVQLVLGGSDLTLQRLVAHDYARAALALEQGMRIWAKAGARGVALNQPSAFVSKHAELQQMGFVGVDEIDALMRHVKKHPPIMQVFYRTGHRFGAVNPENGAVRGFSGLHLVGEDVIPPGPGVNPTLAILMVARSYGEAIAARL